MRGELPPHALREVVDHTARCAACAEDWRLAVEVDRPSAAQEDSAPDDLPGRLIAGRFGGWRAVAAATALAASLLVAVGIYRQAGVPGQPTYREPQQATVHSQLVAGQALPRQAAVLRWTPLAGATSYDVSASTEDLRPVANAHGQTATRYSLPAAALAALPPGTRLLWQVDAVFPTAIASPLPPSPRPSSNHLGNRRPGRPIPDARRAPEPAWPRLARAVSCNRFHYVEPRAYMGIEETNRQSGTYVGRW